MASVKRAVEAALHLLQETFQHLVLLPRCLTPDLADGGLPVHAGENEPITDKELLATYASWSKLIIMLSFAGDLSLASVPSSLIHENWTAFVTYAVGMFVSLLLAAAVYCTLAMAVYRNYSFLQMRVMRVLLFISFAIIPVALVGLLTVVLVKGKTAKP